MTEDNPHNIAHNLEAHEQVVHDSWDSFSPEIKETYREAHTINVKLIEIAWGVAEVLDDIADGTTQDVKQVEKDLSKLMEGLKLYNES